MRSVALFSRYPFWFIGGGGILIGLLMVGLDRGLRGYAGLGWDGGWRYWRLPYSSTGGGVSW
ncbi:hypothetical protein T440DRAFT_469489 [Plenodomus tracheiphilus IPT5]|uniref:Uncharacterized protein n=1 Tax=Plenodomus tracheiphilus IPT5 TaxID=1408161 RepID=A0A6A7B4M4_9PLEO|nr:hypothetical protein T440DRAFT_469489 [Plenodomus tracheiphilus IPT5]